jgi:aspartyl-tRNA(Asn)/glutamyl-tRNA(Gln) amidotransferase subunit C
MPESHPDSPQTAPQTPAQTAAQTPAQTAPQSAAHQQLTPEVVAHLANLARIALTPEEIVTLAGELGVIVDSVAKVSEVATPDVPATSHPIRLVNVFRNDVPGPTLTTEQALAGAPEHDGSRFKVSAILGEEQ